MKLSDKITFTKRTTVLASLALSMVLLFLLLLLLPGKPPSESIIEVPRHEATIEITKDGFIPATLSVPKGSRVTWINKDSKPHRVASNPHPDHNGLKGFDALDIIGPDGRYSFIFDAVGSFGYHDHLNPTVNGTIIVK